MLIEKPNRIRDKAYRYSAPDQGCMVCGKTGPDVVLAHINIAGNFGRGLKAGDDESLFLCHAHHCHMDNFPAQRAEWIVRNIVIPQRREAYQQWKRGR